MEKKEIANHRENIIIDHHYHGLNPTQFGNENCAPGHSYGPAVRTHWLLHYVMSGCGVFVREGETYHPKAGDVFVIPPYVETYYAADRQTPWNYIWVGFTTDEELPPVLTQPILRHAGVGAIFEDMRRCYKLENGRSAFLSSRLWELISVLQEQEAPVMDYVQKALNCIHSEYMNGISVKEIAERLNLNRCYFSTLFRETQGIPPQQYLLQLRMERAAELLTLHGERPSVVCASVGYPDLYNFSKAFKSYFGMSPRNYQLIHLRSGTV